MQTTLKLGSLLTNAFNFTERLQNGSFLAAWRKMLENWNALKRPTDASTRNYQKLTGEAEEKGVLGIWNPNLLW